MAELLRSTVLFNDTPCLDPLRLYEQAAKLGYQTSHWAGLPNSYVLPRGKEPGRAYVLLTRGFISGVTRTATNHTLKFHCGNKEANFTNLTILKAEALYSDAPTTPTDNTPYLVELVDCRHILAMSVVNKAYNIRDPLTQINVFSSPDYYSATNYYSATINSGTVYTWQTLLDALWALLPGGASAGSSPTLPYSPNGKPENFRFHGVSAWEAYNTVLEKIDCTVIYNPFLHTFTLVRLGTTQTDLITTYLRLNSVVEDFQASNAPLRNYATEIPHTITVFFRRQDVHYGTEQDTIRTSTNWSYAPYSVDVASGVTGAVTGTKVELWDDLVAIYDYDNTLENSSDLSARATEVAANYVNTLTKSAEWTQQLYRGLHIDASCLPGSQIETIRWFDTGYGMFTEFRQRKGEGALSNSDPMRSGGGTGNPATTGESSYSSQKTGHRPRVRVKPDSLPSRPSFLTANLTPPDFSSFSYPQFPTQTQLLTIENGTPTFTSGGYPLYDAKIVRFAPSDNTVTEGVQCWAMDLAQSTTLTADTRYVGRIHGLVTNSSDCRAKVVFNSGVSSECCTPKPVWWKGHIADATTLAYSNTGPYAQNFNEDDASIEGEGCGWWFTRGTISNGDATTTSYVEIHGPTNAAFCCRVSYSYLVTVSPDGSNRGSIVTLAAYQVGSDDPDTDDWETVSGGGVIVPFDLLWSDGAGNENLADRTGSVSHTFLWTGFAGDKIKIHAAKWTGDENCDAVLSTYTGMGEITRGTLHIELQGGEE